MARDNVVKFDPNRLRYTPPKPVGGEVITERRLDTKKERERRKHFVKVPWNWVERLAGTGGQVHQVALHLLYLHWKGKGAPVKLSNRALNMYGVSAESKRRALRVLESSGLITVERLSRKSPTVGLNV
jgi:hypothetical protein